MESKPTTPGEMLRAEFMDPLGLSEEALADALGLPQRHLAGLLRGVRPVSLDIAAGLARLFKTTPDFWLKLQLIQDEYRKTKLSPIESQEQLDASADQLFELTRKDEPSDREQDDIDDLSEAIAAYEERNDKLPPASPLQVLRFLMEHSGLKDEDLSSLLGTREAMLQILRGERAITSDEAEIFGASFHVSSKLFTRE